MLTALRRALSYRVSIGSLTEIAVWLAGAYLVIGLLWSSFHSDDVQRIQAQLEQQLHLPAGSNYQPAALGEASVLWPLMTVLPSGGCARQ
jgi:hypothetical protein